MIYIILLLCMLIYGVMASTDGDQILLLTPRTGFIEDYLYGYKILEDLINLNKSLFFDGIQANWMPYLGPVINQGNCANCWAVSFVEVYTGLANRLLPQEVKDHYGTDKDGKIILSVD